jgi:hypothetical protein
MVAALRQVFVAAAAMMANRNALDGADGSKPLAWPASVPAEMAE